MIVTKKVTINTPDGILELFQLPEVYVEGSVWVFEVASDNSVQMRVPEEIGEFIKITPAPAVDSTLFVTYNITEDSALDSMGVSNWDRDTMYKIVEMIHSQQKTIAAMDLALSKRVTEKELDTWASVIDRKVKDLEYRIGVL